MIIPVVDFISADNARDVLSGVMKSADFEIDAALIRLGARHVADMRALRSLRNEFEVYRERLVTPAARIPGITDDLVFAMLLYKTLHVDDFERIRVRSSALDRLYAWWRGMVRQSLRDRSAALVEYRRVAATASKQPAVVKAMAAHLESMRTSLDAASKSSAPSASVVLGAPFNESNLHSAEAWRDVTAETVQTFVLTDPAASPYPVDATLTFTLGELGAALGLAGDPAVWATEHTKALQRSIDDEEGAIGFLRHHSWAELFARQDITFDASELELTDSDGEPITETLTFREAAERILGSELAVGLIRDGYVTYHFALYVASYYGEHLGPDAIEYLRRAVEPGIADPSFPLSTLDVQQLLVEQGAEVDDSASFFDDDSVMNIAIVEYLLEHRPAAAKLVARRLLRRDDIEFLNLFVMQSDKARTLLGHLSEVWAGAVEYAALSAPVDPSRRVDLLEAALAHLGVPQAVGEDTGAVLTTSYGQLPSVCAPADGERSRRALQVLRDLGASVEDLSLLDDVALPIAVEMRLFPITGANLSVLAGGEPFGLDTATSSPFLLAYLLDCIGDYLDLVEQSPEVASTIVDPVSFEEVLKRVVPSADDDELQRFIALAPKEAHIPALTAINVRAWPSLIRDRRTQPTFENVRVAIESYGVDEGLAAMLRRTRQITQVPRRSLEERKALALQILAASPTIVSTYTRVQIARSLAPGKLSMEGIPAEGTDLVARLLKSKLVADVEATFASAKLPTWEAVEPAIAASKKFETFAGVLEPRFVPLALRSEVLSLDARTAIATEIIRFTARSDRNLVRDMARALLEGGWRMPAASVVALQAGGAIATDVAKLIQLAGDKRIPDDELVELLAAMGGKYAQVALGGSGRPAFVADNAHEHILERLTGTTVKHVRRRTFKSGERLVATLM